AVLRLCPPSAIAARTLRKAAEGGNELLTGVEGKAGVQGGGRGRVGGETMRVTLLYFAAARERAGVPRETVQLRDGATAADARDAACAAHPALRGIVEHLRLAVDQEFAPPERPLRGGAGGAVMPPGAGGGGAHLVSGSP